MNAPLSLLVAARSADDCARLAPVDFALIRQRFSLEDE